MRKTLRALAIDTQPAISADMAQLDKKYSGAPFGTQTPRFDVAGVHPASKMPASYTQVSCAFSHKKL